jgi:hypothetical protein
MMADRRRVVSSHSRSGRIYYTQRNLVEEKLRIAQLPTPPYQRRQRRPNSIHISRFPSNFQYFEEPPRLPPPPPKKDSRFKKEIKKLASRDNVKRVLGSVFPWSSSHSNAPTSGRSSTRSTTPEPPRPTTAPIHWRYSTNSARQVSTGRMSTTTARPQSIDLMGMPPSRISMSSNGPRSSMGEGLTSNARQLANSVCVNNGERPVCTSNGVSCYITFAEPNLYLSGFDLDTRSSATQAAPAILRGKLVVKVTKSVKIKTITLTFRGKARTEWPEGIPPLKTELFNEVSIRTQEFPFFNAAWEAQGDGYGAMCSYALREKSATNSSSNLSIIGDRSDSPSISSTGALSTRSSRSSTGLSERDRRRLSLQAIQSRSFQKGEAFSSSGGDRKGYKTFHPGVYEYSFEIALDHTCPETIDVPLGKVNYELDVLVERASAFRSNLLGRREVKLIRVPDQESLEQVEPIAITRTWEDQLWYDIAISGKSFPIGGTIPIAFRLTPLAKVQCHRIKVYATESIEYFTDDMRVTRKDSAKKVLLFEKQAGKPLSKEYQGCSINFLHGGESNDTGSSRPNDSASGNLLGDLSKGEQFWGQTEIEMNIKIPDCEMMKKERHKALHPETTWKNIKVYHWIKIVMRLSKADPEDPEGKKRRHFEISIDSPFHILSCLAASANNTLPTYSGPAPGNENQTSAVCGCPGAATRIRDSSYNSSSNSSSDDVHATTSLASNNPPPPDIFHDSLSSGPAQALPDVLARPPPAHLNGGPTAVGGVLRPSAPGASMSRPMHMLRSPSYNPPAFDDDMAPPPAETPPPDYERIVGTPSIDGLADYFARYVSLLPSTLFRMVC